MSIVNSSAKFAGEGKINPDDLSLTEVYNFTTNIDSCLSSHFKSQGKATAVIGLSLSPDNTKFLGGTFVVRGDLDLKEVRFPCNHVWPESPKDTCSCLISLLPTILSLRKVNSGPTPCHL